VLLVKWPIHIYIFLVLKARKPGSAGLGSYIQIPVKYRNSIVCQHCDTEKTYFLKVERNNELGTFQCNNVNNFFFKQCLFIVDKTNICLG
jgi:hypothetical protein